MLSHCDSIVSNSLLFAYWLLTFPLSLSLYCIIINYSLAQYFSSGPIVAMVWQGKGVIKSGRDLLGATNPAQSLPCTIRGDYCIDVGRNIIHGSDGQDSAKHEINFWFDKIEI